MTVLAVITSVWAITSQNRVSSLQREVDELRAGANASVYSMDATDSAPTNIQGRAFISITGSGVVSISNLPQPGDNEEFRIWFLDGDDVAVTGGTLTVNETGQGFGLIPADTSGYTRIAVSLETEGATSPEGNFLLIADVRLGRG